MSLQSIFVDEKMGNDYTKLPNDFTSWQEEIIKKLYKKLPEATKHLVRMDFKKKDEEKGYAVGTIIVTKKDGSITASVPIIVKQFKLAPLDIFIIGGAFFPLNEYSFKKYFTSKEIFSGVIDRREYDMASPYSSYDLYTETHPPFHVKMGAVEKILNTLEPIDIKNFKHSLMNNPESFAKLASNKHVSKTLKSICGLKQKPMLKTASFNKDVLCIEKFGFNKFKVLSNSNDCFNPKSIVWDYKMMKEAGVSMDKESHFEKIAASNVKVPFVQEDMITSPVFKPEMIEEAGRYACKTEDGTTYIGTIIPIIIDWNQKKVSNKLFISGDNYAYQSRIVGLKRSDDFKLSEGKIESGTHGTLIYESGKDVLATIPFEVISMTTCEHKVIMIVRDDLGRTVKLTVTPMIKQITPDSSDKTSKYGSYFVPWDLKFVPLNHQVELVSNPKTYDNFTKVATITDDYLQIIDNDGTYTLKAKNLEKYANVNGVRFDMSMMKPFETKFMLMSFGCDSDGADYILKSAAKHGSCKVNGLNFTPTINEMEDRHQEKLAKYTELYDHIKDIKKNMIKEAACIINAKDDAEKSAIFLNNKKEYGIYKMAAGLDSAVTVDNVLSLNFINPSNIKTFVSMKGDLELTASKLAQLLVASRMGVNNIPENETATAMGNLMYVVEGLDLLEGRE